MTTRVAINGFGRIGRNIVRAVYESGRHKEITIAAINEVASAESMAYLLKYDTSHGRFSWQVYQKQEQLFIENDAIYILHEQTIKTLPWRELNIDIVLDCTGVYGNRDHGKAHIIAGAKKVLFSHLGSNDLDATIVYGVNHQTLRANHYIVSNSSCTANCITPIIKLVNDAYKIESGMITTIHSAMHDQQVIDTYNFDLRRTRAASQSIIPVDTNLASGITRIFPQFHNRFKAIAVRVPTINVTAIDLSVTVKQSVKDYELNLMLQSAAHNEFHDIIDYIESPLVSIDFNHDPHSAIVDGTQTRVSGDHLIKILVWCDNEWSFANRMIDTTLLMAKLN